MVGLEILVSIKSGQRQEFLQTIDLFRSQQEKDKALLGAIEVLGELNSLHVAEIKVLGNLPG
jgi:hypothetical protein